VINFVLLSGVSVEPELFCRQIQFHGLFSQCKNKFCRNYSVCGFQTMEK